MSVFEGIHHESDVRTSPVPCNAVNTEYGSTFFSRSSCTGPCMGVTMASGSRRMRDGGDAGGEAAPLEEEGGMSRARDPLIRSPGEGGGCAGEGV